MINETDKYTDIHIIMGIEMLSLSNGLLMRVINEGQVMIINEWVMGD